MSDMRQKEKAVSGNKKAGGGAARPKNAAQGGAQGGMGGFAGADKSSRKIKKIPKRPSASYFENVSLYYLQRYAATTASLRRVLERRVMKAKPHYDDLDTEACRVWIDEAISKMARLGYVNDETYREGRVLSLRRAGASKRKIESMLAQKGIKANLEDDAEAELQAARAYVKRRRLGSYRTRPVAVKASGVMKNSAIKNSADAAYEKDLASLARQGFSRAIAMAALKPDDANA